MPHTAFWDHPPGWRRAPLYATPKLFGNSATASIQTPLLALAWEIVADASRDEPEFRREALVELSRHYDWLASERDPDGDGLLTILFPDESGLDDSPKYDDLYGWMAHHRPGYFWLVERSRRLGYDAYEIAVRYREHVEDVLVNVAFALGLRALARLIGDEPRADLYNALAEQVERALLGRCWNERRGLFFDLAGPDEHRLQVSTWASLAPLALPNLPEDCRRRLVEEHLLDPRRHRVHTGIPSVALEEQSFRPGFDRFRCWARARLDGHRLVPGATLARARIRGGCGADRGLAGGSGGARWLSRVLQPTHRRGSRRQAFRHVDPARRAAGLTRTLLRVAD